MKAKTLLIPNSPCLKATLRTTRFGDFYAQNLHQLQQQKSARAEEHLYIAAEMIEKMGYGRRKPEVEELRKALGG
jgi:hypothetical protein